MDTHSGSAENGDRHSSPPKQQQQQPMSLGRLLEMHANTQGQSDVTATTDPPGPTTSAASEDTLQNQPAGPEGSQSTTTKKKKKNRHRRRRNHRQSFLAPDEDRPGQIMADRTSDLAASVQERPRERSSFYRGRNLSTTSLESEALLDHRNQPHQMRARRDSRLNQSFRAESFNRASFFANNAEGPTPRRHRSGQSYQHRSESEDLGEDGEEDEQEMDDRTPLIASHYASSPSRVDYGTDMRTASYVSRTPRRPSVDTSSSRRSSRRAQSSKPSPMGPQSQDRDYDVNNPPSVPGSPKAGVADMGYDDAVVTGAEFPGPRSPDTCRDSVHDAVIDMEGSRRAGTHSGDSAPPSPNIPPQDSLHRRRTITLPVEGDVCFPTELAEDFGPRASRDETGGRRRRRRQEWPNLAVLEEWSREEKEERSGEFRVKKISEPVLVGGRLRPQYAGWRREEEEAPYRFTYFNEDFQSTIHAQTISELVQPGGSFRELFLPDPPELEDSSSDEDEDLISLNEPGGHQNYRLSNGQESGGSRGPESVTPARSENEPRKESRPSSQFDIRSDTDTSIMQQQTPRQPKPKRYGPRPTWWLDVLSPTDPEMRVIAKTFGIHALTAEDIMMQEAREKVELFRHYYFLNYRTFEQDPNSENYLQPVNMYVVVFREGVLSFHFSQTPHPANVRRRIRQLRDYLILSSDWICYALIDDITDVFGPLIQSIENEVDDVDDAIMQMHSRDDVDKEFRHGKKNDTNNNDDTSPVAGGDMLRRVGECRKKVMGMYRLLSNKADVIKGFAKRCNEQWEVAPKSEIGLYLGDIQDHIMTMTSNLTHYETLLSRAHSNYLAQINILMNERQERTADVLGKLTVLGTIVLPMNIICGMWGMNVKVPGQDVDNLYWFWSITAGLLFFGVVCFYVAKRVYRIV